MKTITDLRNELINVFDGLKTGDITPAVATELNNAAGKIIATAKVQLEYAALRQEKPRIAFLKSRTPEAAR